MRTKGRTDRHDEANSRFSQCCERAQSTWRIFWKIVHSKTNRYTVSNAVLFEAQCIYFKHSKCSKYQGCTSPGRHVRQILYACTKYLWDLRMELASCPLILAPRNLRWLICFWKTCTPLMNIKMNRNANIFGRCIL